MGEDEHANNRPGSDNRESRGENDPSAARPSSVRRSGRIRKPAIRDDEDYRDKLADDTSMVSPMVAEGDEPRRNPKRKTVPENFDIPDDLLEKSLAPMRFDERGEWASWIEVESDPVRKPFVPPSLARHPR